MARVAVLEPTPVLTIMIEPDADGPDIHLHPGGQGLWVTRMAATLGVEVLLCAPFGGESGRVLRSLIETEPLTLRGCAVHRSNGVYIHDRRAGRRVEVAASLAKPLRRHEVDDLYGIALTTALDADVLLLTGPQPPEAVDPSLYSRLARDTRRNGGRVIADLTGPALRAVLAAGVDVLKISHEEIVAEGFAAGDRDGEIVRGAARLHDAGAASVLISRGRRPSIALVQEGQSCELLEVASPRFDEVDHHGAGDSMFAALGAMLARGAALREALRVAAAAGALNVTRHGLGSGTRPEIERLAGHVTVRAHEPARSDGG